MTFIYHFENNEHFGPRAGQLLRAAEAGEHRGDGGLKRVEAIRILPIDELPA